MNSTMSFSGLDSGFDRDASNVEIPQSWVRVPDSEIKIHNVVLKLSGFVWQPFAETPFGMRFGEIVQQQPYTRLAYRGCPPQTADYLQAHGFKRLCSGMEAVLKLADHTWKRSSLRELSRRGLRFGHTKEFLGTAENAAINTEKLFENSRYATRPKLQYLFRLAPDHATRCFYFCSNSGEWLAAITLSIKNPRFIATELLLRRSNAPIGVMEALVEYTAEALASEGFEYWSLGEVPFYQLGQKSHWLEPLYMTVGRMMRFAYNYRGLHAFKDKYRPLWRPVYLCAKPEINLLLLADMTFTSGFFRLATKVVAEIPAHISTAIQRSFLSS